MTNIQSIAHSRRQLLSTTTAVAATPRKAYSELSSQVQQKQRQQNNCSNNFDSTTTAAKESTRPTTNDPLSSANDCYQFLHRRQPPTPSPTSISTTAVIHHHLLSPHSTNWVFHNNLWCGMFLGAIFLVLVLCVGGSSDRYVREQDVRQRQFSGTIPKEVLGKLRGLKTHSDFLSRVNLVGTSAETSAYGSGNNREASSKGVGETEPDDPSRISVVVAGQSWAGRGHIVATDDNYNGVGWTKKSVNRSEIDEVIDDPVRSDDTCVLSNHCVPLPVQKKQGFYYVPECITLPTCAGGCCDRKNTCHATKIKNVVVKLRIYQYAGGMDFKFVEDTYVPMERHEECSCDVCEPDACPRNQHWEDCRCVCNDGHQANSCQGVEKEWSEESCECRCKARRCGPDQFLDPLTCRCMYISGVNDNFVHNSAAPVQRRRSAFSWS